MGNEVASGRHLQHLLSGLAQRVSGVRSVLLTSADGIPKAAHGMDWDEAGRAAALTAGFVSLARGLARDPRDRDAVRHVMAEVDDVVLFVTAAADGTELAVLAETTVDVAVVGYEVAQLVKAVCRHLDTPARQDPASACAADAAGNERSG
jgi:predicted regulator of Ras-like GTPase activity (Roadblock/LC7/MglB family)